MPSSRPIPVPCQWFARLASACDRRSAPRLALLFLGAVLARGRRAVTSSALDDTPTQRYGPHVHGAGVHHNPPPGSVGSPYVFAPVFVVLGILVTHPAWGVIALPLLARLYVRKDDLPAIDPSQRPAFRTKLELAVELLRWARMWLGLLREPI